MLWIFLANLKSFSFFFFLPQLTLLLLPFSYNACLKKKQRGGEEIVWSLPYATQNWKEQLYLLKTFSCLLSCNYCCYFSLANWLRSELGHIFNMSPPSSHPSPFKWAQQQNNSTLISNFMGFVKAKLLINQRSLYQGWTFHRLCVAFQSNPSQFFPKRQNLAQRDLRTSKHFSGDR